MSRLNKNLKPFFLLLLLICCLVVDSRDQNSKFLMLQRIKKIWFQQKNVDGSHRDCTENTLGRSLCVLYSQQAQRSSFVHSNEAPKIFKMGQSRPLFVYFCSFHIPIQMINLQFEQYKLKKT